MHRLFVLLSLLAVVPFAHAKDVPFQATSVGTSFAIAGDLKGTFDAGRDKVTVTITDGYLVRQPCPYQGERKVTQITAFLAGWTKGRRNFEPLVYSAPLKIDKSIALGEKIPLGRVKFEIPVKGLKKEQLKKSWLAFSIVNETKDEQGKPRGGSSYIHAVSSLGGASTGFPAKREETASGDLKALEESLAPAMADLTPKPSLTFLPEEKMLHVDYRTKAFKVSDLSYIGTGMVPPGYAYGPDEQGFMLTAQAQEAGKPNSLSEMDTPKGVDWKTEMGVTRVQGTSKQVSWSLSYGKKTDPALLEKLRASLKDLKASTN